MSVSTVTSHEQLLAAIHECVIGSTIRHVLKFSPDIILEYLSTYPFYRGADTLYYFLLRKIGPAAHYAANGKHLVTISPELIGVYVLAEQDVHVPKIKGDASHTIYEAIQANIDRTITCERYAMRNAIIIGEAPFDVACKIPGIAMNIPAYQAVYTKKAYVPTTQNHLVSLIEFDCWEPVNAITYDIFVWMLQRMACVKGLYSNLWTVVLKKYYMEQLQRLSVSENFPTLCTKYLANLYSLLPELVPFPSELDTLQIRIWFSNRKTRAYVLGYDINQGIPCDEIISQRLQYMKRVGIEQYASEITGIKLDVYGCMTGHIGMVFYPDLMGKKLMNTHDNRHITLYNCYPFDLFPIVRDTQVCLIPWHDIVDLIINQRQQDITVDKFKLLIQRQIFPSLGIQPSDEDIKKLLHWVKMLSGVSRGGPARIRLVEMMSHDILNY